MSKNDEYDCESERSYERIERNDLKRISRLAYEKLEEYFDKGTRAGSLYRDRLLLMCLCQGAAEHYMNMDLRRGVKDFDVWAFFRRHDEKPFPYRTVWRTDFGRSKFGYRDKDRDRHGCIGRKIDVMGRSIDCENIHEPEDCVQMWLKKSKNKSPRYLVRTPVVVVYPKKKLGKVIWSPS